MSDAERVDEESGLRVLFVCTGNICRSPIAERLAAEYVARLGTGPLAASSAGTRAVVGHPMHREAAAVLEELGGKSARFAARQLTTKIAANADLVLTMTRAHRDAVLELTPRQLHRTFTLSEAAQLASMCTSRDVGELAALRPRLSAHQLEDVPDPVGKSADTFAAVAGRIAEMLPPILTLCGFS